jgi:hypothetical protein
MTITKISFLGKTPNVKKTKAQKSQRAQYIKALSEFLGHSDKDAHMLLNKPSKKTKITNSDFIKRAEKFFSIKKDNV